MALKVRQVDIKEREQLEPLIVEHSAYIEDGLQIIAHQHPTDSGPLDILAVDSDGTLVIMELKNEASDGHLDQGLRYYDWCRQNIAWIKKAYEKYKIVPENNPRLILVAPSFTETVLRISKYVDVDLQLIEYRAIIDENNELGLICTERDLGQPPEPPVIPSMEKKLEYFKDTKARELFKTILAELQSKGIELKPIHGRWISAWYKNKQFMYLAPNRNYSIVRIWSPEGTWTSRLSILKKEDWTSIYENEVVKCTKFIDQK